MYKIAVIGNLESIQGFSAVGLDIFPVNSSNSVDTFKKLVEDKYGIIYITEKLYNELEKYIEKYNDTFLPAIIPIPGITGNNGVGIENVKKFVEKAVGSDIIFGND